MPDKPIIAKRPISNPIPDDGNIDAPIPRAVGRPRLAKPEAERMPRPPAVDSLLEMLGRLTEHLGATCYADCGILINALSKAITDTTLARRQKQEQLDAGTQRAPCSTCGKMIDISKSGGYQILTERDEHFQPRNVYYCSQNCVLAKNMPSYREHERQRKQREAER